MDDTKKESSIEELPSYEESENLDATMVDIATLKPEKPKDAVTNSNQHQQKKADEKELEALIKQQKSLANRLGLSKIFKKKT